jgi:hypothetical protein
MARPACEGLKKSYPIGRKRLVSLELPAGRVSLLRRVLRPSRLSKTHIAAIR